MSSPRETSAPPDVIAATVVAAIAATQTAIPSPTFTPLPTETPAAPADIAATVVAAIAATQSAVPSPTPAPLPTETPTPAPNIAGTVAAAIAATQTAVPSPTSGPLPTAISALAPTSAATPHSGQIVSPPSNSTQSEDSPITLSAMVKRARPAVVRIQSTVGAGSGVIFETQDNTAYVVTNHHVVEGQAEVSVTVNDSTTFRGTVLGADVERDLAVVKICCGSFQKLVFADASLLEPGDEVVVMGYPLGLTGDASITLGIVSAIRYSPDYKSDVIQTDAAINPGNSGGPMLSTSGDILGINTYRIDTSDTGRSAQGLGFAISERTVQLLIPNLRLGRPSLTRTPIDYAAPRPQPTQGITSDPRAASCGTTRRTRSSRPNMPKFQWSMWKSRQRSSTPTRRGRTRGTMVLSFEKNRAAGSFTSR